MVHDEATIERSIRAVERALQGARNSNQAGEDAVVAMAAWGDMKRALELILVSMAKQNTATAACIRTWAGDALAAANGKVPADA